MSNGCARRRRVQEPEDGRRGLDRCAMCIHNRKEICPNDCMWQPVMPSILDSHLAACITNLHRGHEYVEDIVKYLTPEARTNKLREIIHSALEIVVNRAPLGVGNSAVLLSKLATCTSELEHCKSQLNELRGRGGASTSRAGVVASTSDAIMSDHFPDGANIHSPQEKKRKFGQFDGFLKRYGEKKYGERKYGERARSI